LISDYGILFHSLIRDSFSKPADSNNTKSTEELSAKTKNCTGALLPNYKEGK
jgi:hypothetical protein